MQRISLLLAGFAPAALWAQRAAGTELWRVAATTLPLPPALGTGGAAAFWNPAQPAIPERASLALEVIETAPTVGASGVLTTARVRVRPLGQVGFVYGRMGIGDLVRTSLSPDPDPGTIAYYTQTLGATWGMALGRGGTALGATVAYQQTHLDAAQSNRWTLDVGARRTFSDAVKLATATHFLSRLATGDESEELYGGLGGRYQVRTCPSAPRTRRGPRWQRGWRRAPSRATGWRGSCGVCGSARSAPGRKRRIFPPRSGRNSATRSR